MFLVLLLTREAEMSMTCNRRMNEPGPWERKVELDDWRADGTCSFCGGLNPDLVLAEIRDNPEHRIVPTDKSYKIYVVGKEMNHRKCYFQHFNEAQCIEFIKLYNDNIMKLDVPGYFYVWPFFMSPEKK